MLNLFLHFKTNPWHSGHFNNRLYWSKYLSYEIAGYFIFSANFILFCLFVLKEMTFLNGLVHPGVLYFLNLYTAEGFVYMDMHYFLFKLCCL